MKTGKIILRLGTLALVIVCLYSCTTKDTAVDLLPGRWYGSYDNQRAFGGEAFPKKTAMEELTITYLSGSRLYDAELTHINERIDGMAHVIFQFRVDKKKIVVIDEVNSRNWRYNGALIKKLDEKNLVMEMCTDEHDLIVPILEMRRQ